MLTLKKFFVFAIIISIFVFSFVTCENNPEEDNKPKPPPRPEVPSILTVTNFPADWIGKYLDGSMFSAEGELGFTFVAEGGIPDAANPWPKGKLITDGSPVLLNVWVTEDHFETFKKYKGDFIVAPGNLFLYKNSTETYTEEIAAEATWVNKGIIMFLDGSVTIDFIKEMEEGEDWE